MNNSLTYPTHHEAYSSTDHATPQYEEQQKNKQAEITKNLSNSGRNDPAQTEIQLDNLQEGNHIPSSYTMSPDGIRYTTTISWHPAVYTPVFAQAKQNAFQYHNQSTTLTSSQRIALHINAIQQAIIDQVRLHQQQAEHHLNQLTKEKVAHGEYVTTTQEIKEHQAEVCTIKSAIALHYLQETLPDLQWSMHSAVQYDDNEDGHNRLEFSYEGTRYEFHPNSPVQDAHNNWSPHIIPHA